MMRTCIDEERKKTVLDSVPETIRYILSEYLAKSGRSGFTSSHARPGRGVWEPRVKNKGGVE